MGGKYALEGLSSQNLNDKDVIARLIGKWVVEIDELEIPRKTDADALAGDPPRRRGAARARRACRRDLPRPRGAGSLGSEERRRLADALIHAVAFTTGGEALREFIALMEGEAARFHSTEGSAAAPS